MWGRFAAIGFMLGVGWVQHQATLWSMSTVCLLLLATTGSAAVTFRFFSKHSWLRCSAIVGLFFSFACTTSTYQAQARLQSALPSTEENQPFRLRVQIDSLVRLADDSRYFQALVLDAQPVSVPQRIGLRWSKGQWRGPYAATQVVEFPELKPGQVWELTAFLKTPTGARNTGSFDYEGYLFAQEVRAIGTVRGEPQLMSQQPAVWSIHVIAERWRHRLREAMLPLVQSSRWGGVMMALAIGDQASIQPGDGH